MTTLEPLNDRVIVRRVKEGRDLSTGGIHIPETAREKPTQAEVIAVGPGRVTEAGAKVAPSVKVGDRVLVGKYAGTEVTIDDVEHLVVREEDIFAIVRETEAKEKAA